jgi:hypothetical protein
MRRLFNGLGLLQSLVLMILLVGVSGCLSMKTYVDPKYRTATYASIIKRNEVKSVILEASFQVNGVDKPAVNMTVRNCAEKTLTKSGIIVVVSAPVSEQTGRINLVVNNIGEMGSARAKGAGTGLTFGAVGSLVEDHYKMTAVYTPAKGEAISRTYEHSLWTTIGNHSAPEKMELVPKELAFNQIMEDLLLNFLSDLQKAGSL